MVRVQRLAPELLHAVGVAPPKKKKERKDVIEMKGPDRPKNPVWWRKPMDFIKDGVVPLGHTQPEDTLSQRTHSGIKEGRWMRGL